MGYINPENFTEDEKRLSRKSAAICYMEHLHLEDLEAAIFFVESSFRISGEKRGCNHEFPIRLIPCLYCYQDLVDYKEDHFHGCIDHQQRDQLVARIKFLESYTHVLERERSLRDGGKEESGS